MSPARPSASAPQPRRELSRRWFTLIGVAWLAVLLVALWWGVSRPEPTDREQTTVAQAQPFADEAIARVAAAVTADRASVVAVSPFARVDSCEVSVVRGGARYQRTLTAIVPPGTERAVMERVGAALPAEFAPSVRRSEPARLTADVGYWVLLTGTTVADSGEISFVADTGECRPLGDLLPSPATSIADDPGRALVRRLGLPEVSRTATSVSCVDGGAVVSSEIRATVHEGDLRAVVDVPAGSDVVVSEPRRVAYRTAGEQVAVRALDDATVITVTTVCQ